eukprot:COSAG04_NODE_7249_length_1160_cov_1.117813_1_plen_64_part_00
MAGGWQDYSGADNRRLNEAFATYSGSVAGVKAREVELEGGWCVSLEEMRQVSTARLADDLSLG